MLTLGSSLYDAWSEYRSLYNAFNYELIQFKATTKYFLKGKTTGIETSSSFSKNGNKFFFESKEHTILSDGKIILRIDHQQKIIQINTFTESFVNEFIPGQKVSIDTLIKEFKSLGWKATNGNAANGLSKMELFTNENKLYQRLVYNPKSKEVKKIEQAVNLKEVDLINIDFTFWAYGNGVINTIPLITSYLEILPKGYRIKNFKDYKSISFVPNKNIIP